MSKQKFYSSVGERWYVMRHRDPKYIDEQLRQVNDRREQAGERVFLYLVPYQYIKRIKTNEGSEKNVQQHNDLRSDFRNFVFIKATEAEINALIREDWNRRTRHHLHYCRSHSGLPLYASADDMDRLIKVFVSHYEQYHLVPNDPATLENAQVVLKTGFFSGYQTTVTRIRYSQTGIDLTLGIPLFNGNFMLETKQHTLADIEMPEGMQQILAPDFIQTVETDLIAILRHRVKGRQPDEAADDKSDAEKLDLYYILNYLEFADTAAHNHLRTLMLLCASLRKDDRGVLALTPLVEDLLSHHQEASSDSEAFMMAVLFIATHRISYRRAVKQYQQTHDNLSENLSTLIAIIKDIKVRNNDKKQNKEFNKLMIEQSKQILRQMQDCDLSSLSPPGASAMGDVLALSLWSWPEGGKRLSELQQVVAAHIAESTAFDEKSQWLEVFYRLSGVYSPLAHTYPAWEEQCDVLFDDLLAETANHTFSDELICYRLHRNLSYQAPCASGLRTGLISKCQQWLTELNDEASPLWYALPLKERLRRLWILAVLDIKTQLEFDESMPLPDVWDDVIECFFRCHQQLLREKSPDIDTWVRYYHVLVLFFPNCKNIAAKDLYDDFFNLVLKHYPTVTPRTTDWWQLRALLEHHYKDKQLSFDRSLLPHISELNQDALDAFCLDFNRWDSHESAITNDLTMRDMKEYGRECAERLYPFLSKIESGTLDLAPYHLEPSSILQPLSLAIHLYADPHLSSSLSPRIQSLLHRAP